MQIKHYIPIWSLICVIFLNTQAQEIKNQVNQQLNVLQQEGKLQHQDAKFIITSEHKSSTSAIQHIYYSQMINEIIIANTESSLHISSKGELINSNNRFIKNITSKISGGKKPSISAIEALKAIARQMNYNISKPLKIIEKNTLLNQVTKISDGGFANQEITAGLLYILNKENKLVLVWKIDVLEPFLEHYWNFYVDATTGIVLFKEDTVSRCTTTSFNRKNKALNYNSNLKKKPVKKEELLECESCYEVFEMPIGSPYYGVRTVVVNPADSIASPFGWHDYDGFLGGEFEITQGNNLRAQTSQNFTPNGGQLLNFTEYPFDENYSDENKYRNAAVTNVFYWGNMIHDILYSYGFTENAGNFQQNNYGRGGIENDFLTINIQSSSSNCNASMSTGSDGSSPQLLMGICNNKDASFDNTVISHEYAHGLTRRLIGGAMNVNCLNGNEPIKEGYSDWYGLMFTIKNSDIGETPRGYAKYYFDQGENGEGIRLYPYTTDMTVNPLVYDFYGLGDSTYNWVWSSLLWEVTWALINEYGIDENLANFTGDVNQDAGNIMAFAMVTESLKLLNCNPSIINARDAILTANRIIYEGENECILWNAFAKRGLGVGANFGLSSFETLPLTASFLSDEIIICENAGLITNLEGGIPLGGFYSGTGVTDNGDGKTFTFNTEIGVGTYTITYEVGDSFCSIASTNESTIIVEEDNEPPSINCLDDTLVEIDKDSDVFSILDYQAICAPSDNCEVASFNQDPPGGTEIGVGDTIISFEVVDTSGNTFNCSFVLTVVKEEEDVENVFNVYPNPTSKNLIFSSSVEIAELEIHFFDINGREVQSMYYPNFGLGHAISLDSLASGMYFVSIKSNSFTIIKRILKK